MAETEKLVYTVPEARQVLPLSRTTFYQRVADGTIPSVRIGGKILIPRKALEEALQPEPKRDNADEA